LNNELNALFNSSADGLVISDERGTLLKMNRAYEEIIGVKASEFIGIPAQELVNRGFLKEVVTPKAIELKKTVTIVQEVRGKEILFTGSPVFDETGKLVRVIANIRDLTELNSLKRQLTESALKLALYHDELARLKTQMSTDGIIFVSAELQKVLDLTLRVAPVDTTVLITGESGVGKEVIAKIIYETSKRSKAPFIKINLRRHTPLADRMELLDMRRELLQGKKERQGRNLRDSLGGTLLLDE